MQNNKNFKIEESELNKLKKYTDLFEKTFDWGCNDTAKYLYANAIYSIISGNPNFKECEEDFLDYMLENLK